jgi:GDP-L-fucose synthase
MDKRAPVLVAGETTLIGSAISRHLRAGGYRVLPGPGDADLADGQSVEAYFAATGPQYVFLVAGRSGGIAANQRFPADLMLDNLLVASHVIHAAHRHGVRKLVYLASSCCYPRQVPQPIGEAALLSGPLEPTNEAYAVAKIAGIKLCQAYARQHGARFVTAIPANAFGPGDDFSPEESHVIAALVRKVHQARVDGQESVAVWGSGTPRREFIYAPDLADACEFVMHHYEDAEPINLGTGIDLSIRELAEMVCATVGYHGTLEFDATRPDGMPRKVLDSSKLSRLGWRPRTRFTDALAETYAWFLEHTWAKELTHA